VKLDDTLIEKSEALISVDGLQKIIRLIRKRLDRLLRIFFIGKRITHFFAREVKVIARRNRKVV
jgi:hypothetical protein